MKITVASVLGQVVAAAAAAAGTRFSGPQGSRSFGGVNSFFLHAFKEYVAVLPNSFGKLVTLLSY